MKDYVNCLVNESLQIDIEYNADTIDADIEKIRGTVEQKRDAMQKNIDNFQGSTSTLPFSTVHDSIIDYLNEKAALEYLELVKGARSGKSEDAQQIQTTQA